MKTPQLNPGRLIAVLAAVSILMAVVGLVVVSFAARGGASSADSEGAYPGSAILRVTPEPYTTRPSPRATLAPTPSAAATPTPAPSPSIPTPSPTVLAAAATPEPTPAPAVAAPACPRYPILLDPAPDLMTATQGALEMWDAYLGCPAFEIAGGGVRIQYEPGWPGICLDPDIAACTMNGIFLSPVPPLYDARSVIAHELGHLLNFEHGEGPAVMDPARWGGASTLWCDVDTRCD